MKSVTAVVTAIALGGAGTVLASPATYDGAGRVVSGRPAPKPAPPRTVQAPPSKPRALLLPAVQKAAPDQQKPRKQPDRITRDPPMPPHKALMVVRKPKDTDPAPQSTPRRAVLTTRKAGEGQ